MKLFNEIKVGEYLLPNRVFMAPMTRGRAGDNGIPNDMMAKYYAQRASAGLIIAEATAVSRQGHGWPGSPGIYTADQVVGWMKVTSAVHAKGGRIFLQIFHMGRTVLPDYIDGEIPVSASAIRAVGEMPGKDGKPRTFSVPRELAVDEIKAIIKQFGRAAEYALDAGFDGVEIHAANNFLIDCFLRDGTNTRQDGYGGDSANRARILLEITDEVVSRIGAGKTGVRLSPTNGVFGIADSNPEQTFTTVAGLISKYGLAYMHVLEPPAGSGHFMATDIPNVTPAIRKNYHGTMVANGGFDVARADAAISSDEADAIAFGTLFISNPDLVDRLRNGNALAMPEQATFYTPGPTGYIDYPPAGEGDNGR